MPKFKPGDVVMLKSGGPEMTVTEIGTAPPFVTWCVWFHEGAERKGHWPEATLELSEGPPSVVLS